MTDTSPTTASAPDTSSTTAVDTGGTESTTTFSLSPVLVVCIGLVAACVGVWIGFKIAGGELEGVGCPDCADKHVEAVTEPETVVDG